VGGAGKTTVALDLLGRLLRRGVDVHGLTRGYGGRVRGVLRVDAAVQDAALVGDEALLLAAVAPVWVGADRAASARAAVAAGAQALVMDDGLQNPGLRKQGLLVIDGAVGFGNGRVLPAGPLREPVAAAAGRCRAAVLIGHDERGARAALPPGLPVLTARLVADAELSGVRVLAMAGIARPGKFHATLRAAGAEVVGVADFPDHYVYAAGEVEAVLARAAGLEAIVVTTPKDAVRLPAVLRGQVRVVGVMLLWDDPGAIEALLRELVP